ncbi:MAG: hypothetical protein KDJ81_00470, partial [Rhodobacteraceae bacterium]|nr:hypothetical protein [Paracoccaceae bacterium]
SSMDFVVCSRSSSASRDSLATANRSAARELHTDLAGRDEDSIVKLFGKHNHTVLLGKLPDVLENINYPVGFH